VADIVSHFGGPTTIDTKFLHLQTVWQNFDTAFGKSSFAPTKTATDIEQAFGRLEYLLSKIQVLEDELQKKETEEKTILEQLNSHFSSRKDREQLEEFDNNVAIQIAYLFAMQSSIEEAQSELEQLQKDLEAEYKEHSAKVKEYYRAKIEQALIEFKPDQTKELEEFKLRMEAARQRVEAKLADNPDNPDNPTEKLLSASAAQEFEDILMQSIKELLKEDSTDLDMEGIRIPADKVQTTSLNARHQQMIDMFKQRQFQTLERGLTVQKEAELKNMHSEFQAKIARCQRGLEELKWLHEATKERLQALERDRANIASFRRAQKIPRMASRVRINSSLSDDMPLP